MKKGILALLITAMIFSVCGCGSSAATSNADNQTASNVAPEEQAEILDDELEADAPEETPAITIKESPDKYTWYIKNYVGKNCASIGYTSMGGDRMDSYGGGYIELAFVTPDGSYIDIEDDDALKEYVVTGQNIEPNSELKFTFEKDSDGEEYDNLVASQNYEEIVLSVKKVGGEDFTPTLTTINASPDKYTWYISDFVGRNLLYCGYTSMGGDLMHKYGAACIKLVIIADDGSYIDPEDTDTLKNYVVTSQNVAPNTELKLTLETDGNGEEYDNLVETQTIEEIELNVKAIR